MKIALIGPAYPYRGGIALHTNLLYQEFSKDHFIDIINFKRLYPDLLFPGKTQYEESSNFDHIPSYRLLDSINPVSWLQAERYILKYNYDLIIIQFWQPFFAVLLGTLVRRLKNKNPKLRIITLCHNITSHEGSPVDKLLTKFLFHYVDGFLVQSRSVIQDLFNIVDKAEYRYNPHPIYNVFGEPIAQKTARKKLGLDLNDPLILYFGYIRTYKGLKYLIQAFPRIHDKIEATLLIVGEFYDDKNKYLKLIEKTGFKEEIKIDDRFVPDELVNLYFSAVDLLVLPYISATQSGITQIALSYNLPCVVTDVGGLPEVVKEGKTGFIVEPENPEAIAQVVNHFFINADKKEFADNIQKEKEKYSWNNMKNSLLNLYNKIN